MVEERLSNLKKVDRTIARNVVFPGHVLGLTYIDTGNRRKVDLVKDGQKP